MSAHDLHSACKKGEIPLIREAFESNPKKLNEKDSQLGWSPLYRTVISARIEATAFLLSKGADVNTTNNLGESPLHQAADSGNTLMAQLLLDYGADVNAQQNEGDTPLHHSAFRGDSEMIDLLLRAGADANIKNKVTGRTPLHYAVDCKYIECVIIMMNFKADPYITDNSLKSAFDLTKDSQMLLALSISKKQLSLTADKTDDPSANDSAEHILEDIENYDTIPQKNEDFNENFAQIDYFLQRNSSPTDKLNEMLKSLKNEATAGSSNKSTKQNKFALHPIFDWLEKIQLTEYYEEVVATGCTTLDELVKNAQNISKVIVSGMSKPGHKRRFLFRLNEEIENKGKIVKKISKSSPSLFRCCGVTGNNTQAFFSIPSLLDWLKEIRMEAYYSNFVESGYDDHETLVMMVDTDYAVTYEVLEKEIKITAKKLIFKVLKKLEADHLTFFSRNSMARVSFDEPKNVACESCSII